MEPVSGDPYFSTQSKQNHRCSGASIPITEEASTSFKNCSAFFWFSAIMDSLCPLPNWLMKEIPSSTESTIFTASLRSKNFRQILLLRHETLGPTSMDVASLSAKSLAAFGSVLPRKKVKFFRYWLFNYEVLYWLQIPSRPHFAETAISWSMERL